MLLLAEVARQQVMNGMNHRPLEREPLHPLRAPLGADLAALHTPDLFGVAVKKGFVQAPPEAVDEERVQEGFVAAGKGLGPQVAERDESGVGKPQPPGHHQSDAQRIGKEMAGEVDARQARPLQHHPILALGIRRRPAFLSDAPIRCCLRGQVAQHHLAGQLHVVPESHVVRRGRALPWQHSEPPRHHPFALGEESMTADVDAVAVVYVGLRDAADGRRGLDDHRMHVRPRQ